MKIIEFYENFFQKQKILHYLKIPKTKFLVEIIIRFLNENYYQ